MNPLAAAVGVGIAAERPLIDEQFDNYFGFKPIKMAEDEMFGKQRAKRFRQDVEFEQPEWKQDSMRPIRRKRKYDDDYIDFGPRQRINSRGPPRYIRRFRRPKKSNRFSYYLLRRLLRRFARSRRRRYRYRYY